MGIASIMYCRNCGKELEEKAIACVGCGVPPLMENKHCHNCGTSTQLNQVMCIKCGASFAPILPLYCKMGIGSVINSPPRNAQKALRICIGLFWAFLILRGILDFAPQNNLPSGAQSVLLENSEREVSAYNALLRSVAPVGFVAYIVASVGLFMLKHWAAKLYLIALVISVMMLPFSRPSIEYGIGDTLISIADILSGLILGLVFYGNVLTPGQQSFPAPEKG